MEIWLDFKRRNIYPHFGLVCYYDAGVGEAAVVEGGKSAGEAAAADTAAGVAATDVAGAAGGAAAADTAAGAAAGSGLTGGLTGGGSAIGALSGLSSDAAVGGASSIPGGALSTSLGDAAVTGADVTGGAVATGAGIGTDAAAGASGDAATTLSGGGADAGLGSGAVQLGGQTYIPAAQGMNTANAIDIGGQTYVPASTAASSGGASGSTLSNLLTGGNALKYGVPLALGGMSMYQNSQQIPYQKQMANAASQLSSAQVAEANQAMSMSNQAYSNYQNGVVPVSVQQSINDYQRQQEAAIKSNYASQGLSGSSMEQADLAQLGQQVASLQDSATQINFQNAISALGANGANGTGIYQNLATLGMSQNSNIANTWSNLLKSYGTMYANT